MITPLVIPLAKDTVCKWTYSSGLVNQMGMFYIDNMEYQNSNGNLQSLYLLRVHNSEGYADNVTINPYGPYYYYYRKDHLGDNREVWRAAFSINGTVTPATTVQRTQYYPSGLPWASNTSDSPITQPYKFNGKEFDEMSGYDTYDYGARGYYPALGCFQSVDRFAEKYPWQSPYCYAANNPVNYIDVNGDSINLEAIQQFDQQYGTNYSQTILNDWQSQTGLSYSISSNGSVTYDTDDDGNPIVTTTSDENGNTVQVGSATARSFLMGTIDNKDMVNVSFGSKSFVPEGSNDVALSPRQIEGFIQGSNGVDNKSLGWGMTLIHELHHTNVGGGLSDYPGEIGPVETQMNIIRSELNTKGGNYGQRMSYEATQIPNGAVYLPFNSDALNALNFGLSLFPTPFHKYIRITK